MRDNQAILKHGGRLNEAVKKYAIEKDAWLDLSTGINPNSWPVPDIPAEIYRRLPETDDGLLEAAQSYYQVQHLLAVSGSQVAIQLLPEIFQRYGLIANNPTIGIISPCYGEHEYQWQKQKCVIKHLTSVMVQESIDQLDVLILVNPNNPSGEILAAETVLAWQQQLKKKQGFIIIDEAFMDSTGELSILPHINSNNTILDNLIVLRSVGKFFGLAGVRCGFVIASARILALLEYHQGPWSVSGPARWIVKKALSDKNWIKENSQYLEIQSQQLEAMLAKFFNRLDETSTISGTHLFKTVCLEAAACLYQELAQRGVLVRLLDNEKGLRFGLPGTKKQWQQLAKVLDTITVNESTYSVASS